MQQITLEEAASRLPQLIAEHEAGEEVVITRNSQPVAKLVIVASERPRPQFGSARGMGYMTADFDAPLEDFKEYME